MKSDGARLALFSMNYRVGSAFTAMGERQDGAQIPSNVPHDISPAALARAAAAGDFQLAPASTPAGAAVRVTNKQLPLTPGAYVLADGGGERFGGNTFLARNANTTGQFLFIVTEGGPGGGRGAFSRAPLRKLLRARRRDVRLGVRQGRAAPQRRLLVTLRLIDGLPHTFFNRTDLDEVAGPLRMQVREHPRGGPERQREERVGAFAAAREFFSKHLR